MTAAFFFLVVGRKFNILKVEKTEAAHYIASLRQLIAAMMLLAVNPGQGAALGRTDS